MKKISALFLLVSLFHSAFAQKEDDDKNVVISKCRKTFRFVKGNSDNPVQIREESNVQYTCTNYRTDVPVSEFYNGVETIDDVDIRVDDSRKNGIQPRYEYYNSNGIFYSDEHICYFSLPLVRKGSTSQVAFKKTTLDPRYFTNIFFSDSYEVQDGEITLKVPSWMKLEVKEYNFKAYGIQKNVSQDGDETVYTYTMRNLPALKKEVSAPGITYYAPHILVLCKSAQPKDDNYIYFNTVKDQYAWYRSLVMQIGNDDAVIKAKSEEITKGLTTDEQKAKAVFLWVQDNIRYIAYENGLAGFKPEKAQEVLRKKYGDCKGMANLLTVMLRSLNLDARRCWIGTKHIAYDYSTPSLSVDNHMICAWMSKGKPVYLDATEKYIGFGEIAERIQGRQTLIEDNNQYLLDRVPVSTCKQNTSSEKRKFTIEGANLKGHVVQVWKGENKEWLLDAINDIKLDKQEDALKKYLAKGQTNYDISNLKIDNLNNYNEDLKVEYDVVWKDALTTFDKETYLDIDNRHPYKSFKIEADKRKLPYWFDFKNNMVFETEIALPAGFALGSTPEKLAIIQPGYQFNAAYVLEAGKLIYRNEIALNQTEIEPESFKQWNQDIDKLTSFYDQQLVLTQKK